MSNSVSDQKVEDVLSSVRRLVSSELPRKPKPVIPEGPGALVLTQAHRVESGKSEEAVQKSLEDRIAELEAAVGGQNDEFEPDGSEDQAQHRPDRIVYTRPPSHSDQKKVGDATLRLSQISLIETGPANDDPASDDAGPVSFRHDRKASQPVPEAPMAVDVPTGPAVSAEVAAFTDPDDVVRNIEARIASGRPISEPLPPEPARVMPDPDEDFDEALNDAVAASVTGAGDAAATPDADHARDTIDAAEFLTDHIDPHVTAAEMLADDDEAEPEEDRIAIGSEMTELDTCEPEIEADPEEEPLVDTVADVAVAEPEPVEIIEEHPVEDTTEPESDASVDQAEQVLAALPAEDAMRLLVARLLREELQGELGERITRNVRKLVRSEVKRALSARDLT